MDKEKEENDGKGRSFCCREEEQRIKRRTYHGEGKIGTDGGWTEIEGSVREGLNEKKRFLSGIARMRGGGSTHA